MDLMKELPERWLIAAWPGMGQVATIAAVYLLSKLRMDQVAEFNARGLFELESVEVEEGMLRAARLPASRFFLWSNPSGGRDIVIFLGEAQPPIGKLALCQRLITEGRALGVTRVFTFSAMATDIEPGGRSRAFAVASEPRHLEELIRHQVAVLSEGRITGLNGVVLAAAAEAGLPAVGLLGEMPSLAPHLPYPSASAAVLRVFRDLAGLDLDLGDLEEYGQAMQEQLLEVYKQVKQALNEPAQAEAGDGPPEASEPREKALSEAEAQHVESLFRQAQDDRAKAFELKKELDRLGVFPRFEDRFLDLFEPRQGP